MATLDSTEPFLEESVELDVFKEEIIKEITSYDVTHLACFSIPLNSKEFKFTAAANWSNKSYGALILYPLENLYMSDQYVVQFVSSMLPLTQVIWSYKNYEDAIEKINNILGISQDRAVSIEDLYTSDMDYAVYEGDYQYE